MVLRDELADAKAAKLKVIDLEDQVEMTELSIKELEKKIADLEVTNRTPLKAAENQERVITDLEEEMASLNRERRIGARDNVQINKKLYTALMLTLAVYVGHEITVED
ncbi:MAG: hypothetical protein ACPGJV_10415 [Bacteriovoracaceae bacterium]